MKRKCILTGLFLAVTATGCVHGANTNMPAREMRFRIDIERGAAEMENIATLWGYGWIQSFGGNDTDADTADPIGLRGGIPINRYFRTQGGFRFVPRSTGWATFSMASPDTDKEYGRIFRGTIAVSEISATGTTIINSDFKARLQNQPAGWSWQGTPGKMNATDFACGVGRRQCVSIPAGSRLSQRIRLEAGRPVVIRFAVRADTPPDFRAMRAITSDRTPAHRAVRRFQRGVNLGNYLEAPPDEDWGARYDAADFDAIKEEGFDHVRIPIAWHHHTGPAPDHGIDEKFFERVDLMVSNATARDLSVIINWHHFDAFTDDPHGRLDHFETGWKQIATRYIRFPGVIAFELLNEPRAAADTFTMNEIYQRLIGTLREVAPHATLFVGPGDWNNAAELPWLRLPANDSNIVVTIHNYDPFLFTHQGSEWNHPMTATTGIRFPGPDSDVLQPERDALADADWIARWFNAYNQLPTEWNPCGETAIGKPLRLANAWSAYYGRPVHVGEWGCIVAADPESRARYYQAKRRLLDALDMPWAIWDWTAHFRYWDTEHGRPVPGLRQALFPESR